MRLCLGRIVACFFPNEITAMFVREFRGSRQKRKPIITVSSTVKCGVLTMSQFSCRLWNRRTLEDPPTNISATVRFISRSMARVRRLRFFIRRTIDRRFTVTIATDTVSVTTNLASHADVLRGSSRVPAPLTSAETTSGKFLSHCSQISVGAPVEIIAEPIGAVEVKVLTSQTRRTSSVQCSTWQEYLGNKRWSLYISLC